MTQGGNDGGYRSSLALMYLIQAQIFRLCLILLSSDTHDTIPHRKRRARGHEPEDNEYRRKSLKAKNKPPPEQMGGHRLGYRSRA